MRIKKLYFKKPVKLGVEKRTINDILKSQNVKSWTWRYNKNVSGYRCYYIEFCY